MIRKSDFQEHLVEKLQDQNYATMYLNGALKQYSENDAESKKILLMAINDVAQAQEGITKLSRKTGLGRESLYKTLSFKR